MTSNNLDYLRFRICCPKASCVKGTSATFTGWLRASHLTVYKLFRLRLPAGFPPPLLPQTTMSSGNICARIDQMPLTHFLCQKGGVIHTQLRIQAR